MSVKVAVQVAGGMRDVGLDWSEALATIPGETIVGSEWELLHGSIEANISGNEVNGIPGNTFDSTQTAIWFRGGEEGSTSTLRNIITTVGGREIAENLIVQVVRTMNPLNTVHDSRRFRLLPTDRYGLVGETPKSFGLNLPITISIDFANDLPLYGRVVAVDNVVIKSGDAGGIDVLSMNGRGTEALVRFEGLTAGAYELRAKVTYESPLGDEDQTQGTIQLNLVA